MVRHYKIRIEHGGVIIGVRVFSVVTFFDNEEDPSYVSGTMFAGGAGGENILEIDGVIRQKIPNICGGITNAAWLMMGPNYASSKGWTDVLAPMGFGNIVVLNSQHEGDKFIFANGNYIQFSEIYTSGEYTHVKLTYKLESGVIAFTFEKWARISGEHNCECIMFPWFCGNHDIYDCFEPNLDTNYNADRANFNFGWTNNAKTSYANAKAWFTGLEPLDEDDPYPDVPDSEPDDPDDPDGIPTPDPIPIPPDPNIEVTDVGFVTLFAPTRAQLKNLANYMWSGPFDLNSFRKIFADPMDCILGLNILPFTVQTSGSGVVSVGNISTGITMNIAASQWVTIDCGSVNIGKVYDTYLDYAPYTKMHIYLPFIGIQDLNTDDVAHKELHLQYRVDILSCACIAYLLVDDRVLYQFAGSCGYSVPVNASNFTSLYQSIVDVGVSAAMLAVTVGTAGAGAPAAGTAAAARAEASASRMVAAQQANLVGSSASAVTNAKPAIKRSGALGGGAGFLSVQKPYILVEIPRLCKPARQPHHVGYPSYVTIQVSGLTGLGIFESIILDGVPCTEEERAMLQELFMGGVYV